MTTCSPRPAGWSGRSRRGQPPRSSGRSRSLSPFGRSGGSLRSSSTRKRTRRARRLEPTTTAKVSPRSRHGANPPSPASSPAHQGRRAMTITHHQVRLPTGQEFEQWRDAISTAFVPLTASTTNEKQFTGVLVSHPLGAVQLSSVGGGPVTVDRDRTAIRRADPEYYKLGLQV